MWSSFQPNHFAALINSWTWSTCVEASRRATRQDDLLQYEKRWTTSFLISSISLSSETSSRTFVVHRHVEQVQYWAPSIIRHCLSFWLSSFLLPRDECTVCSNVFFSRRSAESPTVYSVSKMIRFGSRRKMSPWNNSKRCSEAKNSRRNSIAAERFSGTPCRKNSSCNLSPRNSCWAFWV